MVSLKKWGMIAGFMGLVQSVLWVAISFSFLIIHDLEINYKVSNNSLHLTFYESFIKKDEEGPNLVSLFMIIYLLLSLFWFAASIYLLKTVKLEQEEPMILANTKRYSHLIWSVLTFLVCVLDIAFTISITTGFVKIPYQRVVFNGKFVEATTNRARCHTNKLMDKADLFWVALSKREAPNYDLIRDDLKYPKSEHLPTNDLFADESMIKDHEISESKISGYLKQFLNPSLDNVIEDVMINDSFISRLKEADFLTPEVEGPEQYPYIPDLDEVVYKVNDQVSHQDNILLLPSPDTDPNFKILDNTMKIATEQVDETDVRGESSTELNLFHLKYNTDKNKNFNSNMRKMSNSVGGNVEISMDNQLYFNKGEDAKLIDEMKNDSDKQTDMLEQILEDKKLNNTTILNDKYPIILNEFTDKNSFKNERDNTESSVKYQQTSDANKEQFTSRVLQTAMDGNKANRDLSDLDFDQIVADASTTSNIVIENITRHTNESVQQTSIKNKFFNEYEETALDDSMENSNESKDYSFEGKTFENFLQDNSIPSQLVNEMKQINHVIHENLPLSLVSKFYNPDGEQNHPEFSDWKGSPEFNAHLDIHDLQKSMHGLETPNLPDWYTRKPNDEKNSFKQLPRLPSFGPTKIVVIPNKLIRNSSILIMLLIASRFGVLLLLNFMLCLVAFYLSMRYAQMYKEEKDQNGSRLARNPRRQTSRPNLFSDFNESSTVSLERPRTPRLNKNIAFVIPMQKD